MQQAHNLTNNRIHWIQIKENNVSQGIQLKYRLIRVSCSLIMNRSVQYVSCD